MAGKATPDRLATIIERLNATYPDAKYELNWNTPLQLLVGTILAAQATDVRVNHVLPVLFRKYPDAQAIADADRADLEEIVRPTGYYRQKAKTVQECCKKLVADFGGQVPRAMDELTTLPGVARKTANVVLTNAFRIPSGIIVDTHVQRVSQRLGLTDQTKPEKIEQDLMDQVPKNEWIQFGAAMVLLGRYVCTANNPKCPKCVMNDVCPKVGVDAVGTDLPASPMDEGEDEAPAPRKKAARKSAKPQAAEETSAPHAVVAKGALAQQLPPDWRRVLVDEIAKPYFAELEAFVTHERETQQVFPPPEDVFNAFRYTPYEEVKVLLLGQDPYHDDGQAHGLCFSVKPPVPPPPSLVNIYKEMQTDLGIPRAKHGCLTSWAKQGVMLLNAVLTVRAHQPASHKDRGWEKFTDAVIRTLNQRERPVVFLLWGGYAQKKAKLIDASRHRILATAHPSPLSMKNFFGSKPFSQANAALEEFGETPIDWRLPERPEVD
jgi:uracil-DNA glycosylase